MQSFYTQCHEAGFAARILLEKYYSIPINLRTSPLSICRVLGCAHINTTQLF
jgi:hypothetical protein